MSFSFSNEEVGGLTLKISCNRNMVVWDLNRPNWWDFLFKNFFSHFLRGHQHLTCHI